MEEVLAALENEDIAGAARLASDSHQRDQYVQKYNDIVKDRNNVVSKYNELADAYQKLQAAAAKAPEK
jgi:hypothetical protein